MSERAIASFEITTWDEQAYDERDGIKLSRARVVKAFRGEIEGESTAELLLVLAGEGSAAYVGMERVSGRVNGREGASSTPTPRPRPGGPRRGTGRWWPGRGRGSWPGSAGSSGSTSCPRAGTCPPSTTSWADRAGSSAPWRPW